ncbi:DNA-binding response regulator [Stenotrophomonas maltophilia]|jgi:DNA-binding response OmpR family regulator|uniref:Response regulator transcription factor n=1 Tax=Pseudoxanthomonas winnipegensis TaxID=2480810 RepID=A0A4Q8M505_9GAMM|nr:MULTISPECIES: response regulator transcription factor [Gammaproteobacteria]PZP58145.1 MAG: DNA-binding response regulator [Pseudoxanthomonas spadix]CCH11473.1 two component transcriptional regulator, winged helix family [Stenotrophomonas maltophilia D457]EKU9958495.1 response regulator transcription factor [Stenotrophomonas maltophilia]EKU9984514.1 response regulator transcription factor [Stenotrophomonas maltophilia]ELK4770074.1 response regulator transcription factor [Pseudomonas aerugino
MQQSPRILVVDDEPNLRRAVEVALRLRGFEVDTAANGREALARIAQRRPDAIVLDLAMPDIDGLALLPLIRKRTQVPVLMLTASTELGDKIVALEGGADDYLTKPFAMDELKARLVAHLRRGAGSSDLLAYADLRVDPLRRRAWKSDSPLALSAREFDLLVGLMREQGRVFRKSQLLESVWGVDAEVGTETVDRFVSLLRAKLEADGSPRLVQTVRGVGYTLRIEEKIG